MQQWEYSDNNRINETILQNIQLTYNIKQAESVFMKAQGELKGNLNESQGRLSGSSPLRSDGFCDSQAGKLDSMTSGQRQTKMDNWDQVHFD